jgi:hypothetical protein
VLLSYRTQLTLSPKDGAQGMLVKSGKLLMNVKYQKKICYFISFYILDHFTPEFSPRLCRVDPNRDRGGESSSGSEHVGTSDESQDACRMFVNSPPGNKVAEYHQHRFSFEEGIPKYGAFADPSSSRRTLSTEFTLPELPVPTFMKFQSKESKPASQSGPVELEKYVHLLMYLSSKLQFYLFL